MRIIGKKRLRDFWESHRDAKNWLVKWHEVVGSAQWRSIRDARRTFPHADGVKVGSGKTATVFNVRGNKYRMVTAIRYDGSTVYVLWLGTHAEYTKGSWKDRL